jgi:hypothetical protein
MNKIIGLLSIAGIVLVPSADAVVNPSYATGKVYEMRLSENADCTNSVRVFRTESPSEQDFVANPSFGSGAIPRGTYHCLMLQVSDMTSFKPESSEGNCVAGTTYTRDTFRTGSTSTAPDGTTISGRGAAPDNGTEDTPWSYFSTSGSMSNDGMIPSSPFPLSAPLVVNGDKAITYVVNQDGAIDGTQNPCELGPSTISFR